MGPPKQLVWVSCIFMLHFIEKEKSRDRSDDTRHSVYNLKVEDTHIN